MIITIETDDFPIDARFSINGNAFKVIADEGKFLPEEVSLRNIIGHGLTKMAEAVEAVIAKHEGEVVEAHIIIETLRQSEREMDLIRRRNLERSIQADQLLFGYLPSAQHGSALSAVGWL